MSYSYIFLKFKEQRDESTEFIIKFRKGFQKEQVHIEICIANDYDSILIFKVAQGVNINSVKKTINENVKRVGVTKYSLDRFKPDSSDYQRINDKIIRRMTEEYMMKLRNDLNLLMSGKIKPDFVKNKCKEIRNNLKNTVSSPNIAEDVIKTLQPLD